jgi:hypothetical protein
LDDAVDHGVEVFQDFGGGNAEGMKTYFREALVANCVALGAITTTMELAVHFDRQSCGEAGEVEAISELWVLSAEQEPAGFPAELLPE